MSNAQKKASILSTLKFASNNYFYTAKDLADACGIRESNDTCPNVRGLVKDLIDDGYVIGSTSRGYALLKTGKEVQAYLNSLLKRQMGISNRIAAVYKSAMAEGIL
jgi:hypothetical protein